MTETRQLFHYTSTTHWPQIQNAGYLKVVDSNLEMRPTGTIPEVVHLTDEPNLRPAMPNAGWARLSPVDKTRVRIAVNVADAIPYSEYCARYNASPSWLAKLNHGMDPSHWYVLPRPIPNTEWGEIRIGDIPVGKRPISKRRQEPEDPPWKTPFGVANCDFCGLKDHTACYRYECPPFAFGDGWHNGWPGESPRLGDWAACWYCAELVQKRDIATLCVRADAAMKGKPVRDGGKHGTESGMYEPEISHARIHAFFEHYTRKRWFIGKCDFCSVRGETVRWLYDCGTFTTEHPLDGRTTTSDTPWCVCDACAKVIDKSRPKLLTERAIEYQIPLWEQEGLVFTPALRGRLRLTMANWVGLFFKHKKGTRRPIPDLALRAQIPEAPVPAQAALDQQLTLLRWLRGSDGRAYLAQWNDAYGSVPYKGRVANDSELAGWELPLRHGEAFFWEPHVAEAIKQSADELAEASDVSFKLHPSMLPAPQGFFYSDVPFGESAGFPCRAIGWTIALSIEKVSDNGKGMRTMGVTVPTSGGGDPSSAEGIILTFWSQRPNDRVLRPSGHVVWSYGANYRTAIDSAWNEQENRPDTGRPRMFTAMLAFIQQRIVLASRGMAVSSVMRKRIEREEPQHEPTVRVITLRRKQRADYDRPSEPTDRVVSVQFPVRGHWHPSHCFNPHGHREAEASGLGCNDHGPVYIPHHWRGPEDAPVRMPAKSVFDVAV